MKARIKLWSTDYKVLEQTVGMIKETAERMGVKVSGPIPLPTKKLKIAVRYSPDGQGSETYQHWEMRIHKRILEVPADDRVMKALLRIPIPDKVKIEIKMLSE
ncbi:MAG: 30S ribosomal protein S10 [Candidatus Diapherotrites archaeon]|nr:30S ribosomal protein S10 [Candidatus Diapherotrites archaeon]